MRRLVLGEISGIFVNTLTADHKYPFQDCENLPLTIQMQLSEKRKTFSHSFVTFAESTPSFKQFEKKKMIVRANVFPKLETVKNLVRTLSKKRRSTTRFDTQDEKTSEILAESP